MHPCSLLAPRRIHTSLRALTKTDILRELAGMVEDELGYQRHLVFQALQERERIGSTALGNGIAVPHVRLVGLTEATGFFVRLDNPVDFGAVDGGPVDLVFLLLAPPASSYTNALHLQALAAVSRALRERVVRARLRAAVDGEGILAAFTDGPVSANAVA